jgi:hypothetical protein
MQGRPKSTLHLRNHVDDKFTLPCYKRQIAVNLTLLFYMFLRLDQLGKTLLRVQFMYQLNLLSLGAYIYANRHRCRRNKH